MGKTPIEWTDYSWNPIRGTEGRWHCTHVSEGCRHCYAERINRRWGGPEYKPGADTFRLDEKILEQPLSWMKERKVFPCDMTDLFHEEIPQPFVEDIFGVMALTPHVIYQVLTKRAERMLELLTDSTFWAVVEGCAQRLYSKKHPHEDQESISLNLAVHGPLPNVWLGVSVEDQKTANERIPLLLQTPAPVHFLSYEPALGPVDFTKIAALNQCTQNILIGRNNWNGRPMARLDWLICGGESGPEARPMHPAWVRSARDQCQAAGMPFFFKQWGEWAYGISDDPDPKGRTWALWPDGRFTNEWEPGPQMKDAAIMFKVGKKRAGRILDGREWNEFPKLKGDLR